MNRYYHAFKIGFNWWEIVAPTFAVIVAVWGFNVPWIGFHKGEYVVKEGSEKKFELVPAIFALIFTLMFIVESYAGVIQWFDNHADATTDGAWSVILCVPAMVFIGAIYGVILMLIMAFFSNLKCKILEPKVRKKNIARFKRNAKRLEQNRKEIAEIEMSFKNNDFSVLDRIKF